MKALTAAHELWLAGRLADKPLVTLRLPAFADPLLAPIGKAVMTATISAVPSRMSGGWEEPRREQFGTIALAAAERAIPGVASLVLAQHVIVGGDVERALGTTEGDLDGEIAPTRCWIPPLRERVARWPHADRLAFPAGSSAASPSAWRIGRTRRPRHHRRS
jgi:phytoene dehydrogenase-like protein